MYSSNKLKLLIYLSFFVFLLTSCKGNIQTKPPELTEAATNPIIIEAPATVNDPIVAEEPVEEPKDVVLTFMGDVMMDSFIADYIRDYGVDYPWTDVTAILQQSDLAIANLETSVSTRGSTKKPTGFGFRSAPETLQGLNNAGIDLVTLANNHVKDFGDEAFYDTLSHLTNYDIAFVGAGKNINEAEQMVAFEVNGLKLGFISYTSILPWKGWEATQNTPGVAPLVVNQYEELLANIRRSKESTDILTVILHWGTEYQDTPNEWQIALAHQIIDYGADIIVGHHPHILQGIEFYQGKPILYSIGNFVFLKKDDHAGKTGVFELVINKNGFKEGKVYPVNIKYTKANLLDSESSLSKEIINNLGNLSKEFGTEVDANGSFYPTAD